MSRYYDDDDYEDDPWEEDTFPSFEELYQIPIEDLERVSFTRVKKKLEEILESIRLSRKLREKVIDLTILRSEQDVEQFLNVAERCASEILDVMLGEILQGEMVKSKVTSLVVACLAISMKLLGTADWVSDERLMKALVEASGEPLSFREIGLMEKDILAKTNWRGCSNIDFLSQASDDEQPDYNEEQEYKEMLEQAKAHIRTKMEDIQRRKNWFGIKEGQILVLDFDWDKLRLTTQEGIPIVVGGLLDIDIPGAIFNIPKSQIEALAIERDKTYEYTLGMLERGMRKIYGVNNPIIVPKPA